MNAFRFIYIFAWRACIAVVIPSCVIAWLAYLVYLESAFGLGTNFVFLARGVHPFFICATAVASVFACLDDVFVRPDITRRDMCKLAVMIISLNVLGCRLYGVWNMYHLTKLARHSE